LKKIILLVIVIGIGFNLFAQNVDFKNLSDAEKLMFYESANKSTALAVFFSCILPTSGHAYAGKWKRGLLYTGAELAWFYGVYSVKNDCFGADGYCENGSTYDLVALLGTSTIFIFELVDVAKTTKKFNNNLYEKIYGSKPYWDTGFIPQKDGIKLILSYNF
jgi:hypothetical protein